MRDGGESDYFLKWGKTHGPWHSPRETPLYGTFSWRLRPAGKTVSPCCVPVWGSCTAPKWFPFLFGLLRFYNSWNGIRSTSNKSVGKEERIVINRYREALDPVLTLQKSILHSRISVVAYSSFPFMKRQRVCSHLHNPQMPIRSNFSWGFSWPLAGIRLYSWMGVNG